MQQGEAGVAQGHSDGAACDVEAGGDLGLAQPVPVQLEYLPLPARQVRHRDPEGRRELARRAARLEIEAGARIDDQLVLAAALYPRQ